MRAERRQEARADARHAVEPVETTEGSMRLAVGDDGLGQRETYTRKPGQLSRSGAIGVDALVRSERPREREDAIAMSSGRLRTKDLDQLDFAGRLTRTGGKPADRLAREPEG
jgi:hypothetical protein